ncbi:hypothetical protein OIDMADRAFT_58941 [Oidiodendron maius Zn]|uniref:DUF1771 domain-containing protein n=1 Tax=Oidiodendron maius (strain Zn) TaxID=913774 RepID=A0A0C3CCK9_OIDMZ|nr:hypothetical protein OIDMADRAFT_58941 [Oidiodendron maius Zn]
MQFSLKLVAAAAFLLPNLIAAVAIPSDAVAKREAFAEAGVEAYSNFEISGRDVEIGAEAARMKRDAYAEAITHIDEVTEHQLVSRTTEAELDAIHTAYKAAEKKYHGLKKSYATEKDYAKKLDIATTAVNAVTDEIAGREKAQPLWKEMGRSETVIANHQKELDTTKQCLVNWNKRKSDAAKKVANSSGGGGGDC